MKLGILGTGMIVKDMLTGIHDLSFESVYIIVMVPFTNVVNRPST